MKAFALLAICLILAGVAHAMPNRFRARSQFGGYLRKKVPGSNRFLRNKGVMRRVEPLMAKIVAKGGCNANVCFVLDGSYYVTDDEYRMQKEFVELAAALIGVDKSAHFAATQYAPPRFALAQLTSDQDAFLVKIAGSSRWGRDQRVRPGVRFCVRQMRQRREDANKIVLVGDGRGSLQYSAYLPPLRTFSRRGGSICAVAVKNANRRLLAYVTRNPAHVLAIDGYIDLSIIVEDVVEQVCGLK